MRALSRHAYNLVLSIVAAMAIIAGAGVLVAQETGRPSMNPRLSLEERAELVLKH